MKAHTTYKIYPIAIKEFIADNYELKNINFGNIKNNVVAILEKLGIDSVLECEWDITEIYFLDKINITKNENKPSDFDEYSNFKFTFSAKEGVSNKEFESAIKTLQSDFIYKYQNRLEALRKETKKKAELIQKKKDRQIFVIAGIVITFLLVTAYYMKTN